MLLLLRCVCMQEASYLKDKVILKLFEVIKWRINDILQDVWEKAYDINEGNGWLKANMIQSKAKAPHDPVSVNGLLHPFKPAQLHLILKTVSAILYKELCKSGSQNVLRLD